MSHTLHRAFDSRNAFLYSCPDLSGVVATDADDRGDEAGCLSARCFSHRSFTLLFLCPDVLRNRAEQGRATNRTNGVA